MIGNMTGNRVDVLIAGGGFAGLTLAIALREALGPSFAVTVADPALVANYAKDERASAIVAGARRLYTAIGVWDEIAEQAQPILDMVVTDSKLGDAVRPVFLAFSGDVEPGEPFAHMIENRYLVAVLAEKAKASGVDLRSSAVRKVGHDGDRAIVEFADGTVLHTRLVVAADGARSAIREDAGIATHGWDYGQSAIVINVGHERDHEGRAEEHFLPAGPFAILPLKGRRCSLVWTESARDAKRIVALPDDDFHAELEQRFKLKLGEIKVLGARRVHPLGFFVARAFVAERIALVGDAAHVIHPIAGQGLNMGLKDVAALAEVIVDAARLGLDPGAADTLERYQRWRRFDTMTMGLATDGLNRLFSNRSDVLRVVRDVGLGLVERIPNLKRLLIREAAGLVGDVPKLLRGEVL
jgi:2-octaprenyl-6-methoxyphenol hydroxylase